MKLLTHDYDLCHKPWTDCKRKNCRSYIEQLQNWNFYLHQIMLAQPWRHDYNSGTWVGWRCKPNRTKACITTETKNLLGHRWKVQHVFFLETMETMEEEGNPIEANPEEDLVGTLEKSLHAFFEMISPRSVWVTFVIYGWWVCIPIAIDYTHNFVNSKLAQKLKCCSDSW